MYYYLMWAWFETSVLGLWLVDKMLRCFPRLRVKYGEEKISLGQDPSGSFPTELIQWFCESATSLINVLSWKREVNSFIQRTVKDILVVY